MVLSSKTVVVAIEECLCSKPRIHSHLLLPPLYWSPTMTLSPAELTTQAQHVLKLRLNFLKKRQFSFKQEHKFLVSSLVLGLLQEFNKNLLT
jgi:hypothetical protein